MTERGPARVVAPPGLGASDRAEAGWDEAAGVPTWVPRAARDYLAHVEEGRTLRDLAREARVHPSTILRRVRRIEAARDDPLVDEALRRLSPSGLSEAPAPPPRPPARPDAPAAPDESGMEARARPVLRRLAEAGVLLVVARDMDNGLVLRDGPTPQRLAVVPRGMAEAMALQGWIACDDPAARLRRYRLAPPGRAVLRRAAEEAREAAEDEADGRLRHMRSLLAESPLVGLSRRRDGDGRPFLSREQVAAGERLREDVELALQGREAPDWPALLADPAPAGAPVAGPQHRPEAARARVARALDALGPGLADVALRCCGLLEGIETLERQLGWSARSGKVVLRIALDRLRRHYREEEGRGGSLIG